MLKKIHTLLIIFGFSFLASFFINLTPLKQPAQNLTLTTLSKLPQPIIQTLASLKIISPQNATIARISMPRCSSLEPGVCNSVPGCKLETRTKTTKTKHSCSFATGCNQSGCSKKTITIGGNCFCIDGNSHHRHITTESQCQNAGCDWIPKHRTICTGTYITTKTSTIKRCIPDPSWHPIVPKPKTSPTTNKKTPSTPPVTCRMSNGLKVKAGDKVY